MNPQVAIVMGSKSDLPVLQGAFQMLDKFGVGYTARVLSAHRTPDEAAAFAKNAEEAGCKVIICAAGMAAHLGGVFAAHTVLPVIGIPVASEPFNGLDSGGDGNGGQGRREKRCSVRAFHSGGSGCRVAGAVESLPPGTG